MTVINSACSVGGGGVRARTGLFNVGLPWNTRGNVKTPEPLTGDGDKAESPLCS